MQATIDGVTYISHEDPAWREEQNYMAMVDLAPFGMSRAQEQLWLREMDGSDGNYEVCCIPFYAYGLALGDVVRRIDSGRVGGVVGKSGRRVLRIFFTGPRPSWDSRPALRNALELSGLMSEWNGGRHVAIDVPEGAGLDSVFEAVQRENQGGTAFWEWGDSKNFAVS